MKDEHIERAWELRCSPYYGGSLELRLVSMPPFPAVIPGAVLAWSSYEGGGATLDLDNEEVQALYDALGEYLAIDRQAIRDEHLAAWRRAESLGAPS